VHAYDGTVNELTEGLFRFETIGEKSVKGRTTPVIVYRAIAPSSRTRFDVSTERGLTPFVGRDREIELLLDGLDRCKPGGARLFQSLPMPEWENREYYMSLERPFYG
jgi:hypothetical protein